VKISTTDAFVDKELERIKLWKSYTSNDLNVAWINHS